jgi:hypothetical protein
VIFGALGAALVGSGGDVSQEDAALGGVATGVVLGGGLGLLFGGRERWRPAALEARTGLSIDSINFVLLRTRAPR